MVSSSIGRRSVWAVLGVGAALGLAAYAGMASADGFQTELVNVNTAGQQGSGGASRFPSVSDNAGIIAFDSRATNLVAADTNGFSDVFVRYRDVPVTIRASVSTSGGQANGDSGHPSMDTFAQFAAFESTATNLVDGDTNGVQDVFVRGLLANPSQTTRRVSVSSAGVQANGSSGTAAISSNARFVAFTSNASNLVRKDTNGVRDIFVHDLLTGKTRRVSLGRRGAQANGPSSLPAISGDGRCVAFVSSASNLVRGDTNNADDVFVRDLDSGTTTRVSVADDGSQANGPSGSPSINGCLLVAFDSLASNLVGGDTNGESDVFVHNTVLNTTVRASVSSTGEQGNGQSFSPALSGNDGRFVAFVSDATNLVAGDTNRLTDIFRWDSLTGVTDRWDVAGDGSQAVLGTGSGQPAITSAGGAIAFVSDAANLVPGDGLLSQDVFVRHP